MKKILSIFSVVLAATAFCPSCTNLESEMYNVINPGIFPKNEEDAKALVTSAAYAVSYTHLTLPTTPYV